MSSIMIIRNNLRKRPLWMNVLMLFCAYMAVIYVPWDFLLKPVAEDEEVWFGILLTGWWAKATEPLHLAIYAAGAWGFWYRRPWMHPWAALYTGQVALGMLVWSLIDVRGPGLVGGLVAALPFLVLAIFLWRARTHFQAATSIQEDV